MKEAIGTLLRLVLKAGGGLLVGKGITDEGTVEVIVGAIITIFGAVWGIYDAKKAAQARQAGTTAAPTPPVGIWLLFVLGFAITLTGCATTQKSPTPLEQKFYDIKTNVIEVVQFETNTVPASETQPEQVVVIPKTNTAEAYTFTPNTTAALTSSTVAAVGGFWNLGIGAIAGAVVAGAFGLWGLLRSKQRETQAEITAMELAQIIETGRKVLQSLPDGAKYEAAWKDWMVKHQAQTEVIANVAQIVALGVDNDKARGAAQSIVNLVQTLKP